MRRIFLVNMLILLVLRISDLFAERQIGITLINNVYSAHNLSNNILNLSESWKYGGDCDVHMIASPGMVFEDDFQSDALLDLYFSKPYDTNSLNIVVREAFIDFLFYDTVSFKAGFIQTDYGFNNNYFHPLNVIEFVPELRESYTNIYIGPNDVGIPGVPSARLRISLPEFVEGLKIGLDQGLIWYDYEHFDKNYFISSLTGVYSDLQAGVIFVYSGNSFGNDAEVRKPVLGMNFSVGLPFKSIFLWEGVFRQESYRNFVQDSNVLNKREALFFNQSVRLETSQEDPFFHNTLSGYAEYFYYDEGISADQYNLIYDFLKNPINILQYGNKLIIKERNFKNNLTFGIHYLTRQRWKFSYQAITELDSTFWQHWFTVGKAFNNVTISGTFIYIPETEEKYQLIYFAKNVLVYLQMSIDI